MFPRFRSRARQDELAPVDPKAEDQVSTSPEAEVIEARASEPLTASDGAQDAALGEGVVEPGELTDGKGQCIDRDCSDSSPHNNELPPENSLPLKGDPDAPNSGSQEAVPGQDPSREDAPASEPCDTVFHARELGRKRPRIESGPSSSKGLKPSPSLVGKSAFTPEQRLLLLDTWRRSGLPAKDFAALINVSKHTLYKWNEQFQRYGPEGLMDQPRRVRRGSKLPDLTRRTILMLKESHPEWGCQRISDMMLRGPALSASASAVARVLHEAGYEVEEVPLRSHPDRVRRFERAKPNELWQTDLFTFTLKRQNRRLHLVAFMDDHSRFLVSYGLHATASTALVLEALEAGIASYGVPEEILTDNGPQYVTWRGKSRFTKQLEKRGIRQIVARPRRPQTLGKIERFWGTLWRELLESAIFVDLGDARTRIGLYVDYYNLQRTHRGIDGAVPADRFFGAAEDVLQTLKERAAANSLDLARHGQPVRPFYVAGQVDGQNFSVHAEGERLILRHDDGAREEVTLNPPEKRSLKETLALPESLTLPEPLCPQGAPPVPEGEPATLPPAEPGSSALDALTAADEGDSQKEEGNSDKEEADSQEEEGGTV